MILESQKDMSAVDGAQSSRELAPVHPTTRAQDATFPGSAQKFLSTHAAAYNTFNVQRHLISARTHRAFRAAAMNVWHEAVAVA
jgi:hypothetical protein